MKKFLPLFIAILLFETALLGISLNISKSKKAPKLNTIIQSAKDVSINRPKKVMAQEAPAPVYYPATHLEIPKIGLSTDVVSVGLDSQNRMDVPDNFVQAGWYNLGYKPGEKGSVVLDGHHDDFNGNPAVFYYLDNLDVGDQITVTDQSGRQFTYLVSDKEIYPYDQLPLEQIFNSSDKARLNMITCHGIWDSSRQDYSERTVIYSELKG